jgi:hypothetical protein
MGNDYIISTLVPFRLAPPGVIKYLSILDGLLRVPVSSCTIERNFISLGFEASDLSIYSESSPLYRSIDTC